MSHRDEALKALEHVEKMLTGPELDPLGKRIVLATLDHAKAEIQAIEETKRPRRRKETA